MVSVRGVEGMGIRIAKVSVGLAIAVLAAVSVTGCSSSDSCADGRTGSNCGAPATSTATGGATSAATSTPASTGGSSVIAPIIIDFSGGTAQFATVGLNNVVVVNVGDASVTSFTGDVGEPTIAKFVPGHIDGGATFNPGIQPLAVGATTVTITDTETSRFVTLDLTVTQ
ncbi:hypothetical protein [Subtercola endophyticus]|uniref:hypothetical protein n=1 Tax=Subtercola endophyticus TaxID=2895559 RepID=UPI001E56C4DB|nr:hypothetical protein [Subtercola endophyticus]UFS57650.1 hypothetical protein LQ955_11325 [Subtercola endophyticus]